MGVFVGFALFPVLLTEQHGELRSGGWACADSTLSDDWVLFFLERN